MSAPARTVDLRGEAASRVQGAAYAALRELRRGDAVTLLTATEPTLLMRSLDLHLRHRLSWTMVQQAGGWRVEVRHRDTEPARDVVELLTGAHRGLDALLVDALNRINAGDVIGARPLLVEFAGTLRRHIRAEDDLVLPFFGAPPQQDEAGPMAVMQREHADILRQLTLIEESLATEPPDAGEIAAFCAILSGTLAKHEQREESNVFPVWRALLARRSEADRAGLHARVRSAL